MQGKLSATESDLCLAVPMVGRMFSTAPTTFLSATLEQLPETRLSAAPRCALVLVPTTLLWRQERGLSTLAARELGLHPR